MIDLTFDRQMTSLEDDAYSFGFIILEALVGPFQSSKREAFYAKEMVFLFWLKLLVKHAHHILHMVVDDQHTNPYYASPSLSPIRI